jgi:hypothetical protein
MMRLVICTLHQWGYLSRCDDRLMGCTAGVRFSAGERDFSLFHSVHTVSVRHEVDHLHLVSSSRMVELHLHSSIRLNGMMPNELSTGQLYLIGCS